MPRTRTTWMEEMRRLVRLAIERTGQSPPSVAEIGVANGETSAMLLREFPQLQIVMVDPWRFMPEYMKWLGLRSNTRLSCQAAWDVVYENAVRATDFAADRRRILRMKSLEAAPLVDDASLCLAFIDAQHTSDAVLADCDAWWPKVLDGGILAGDDWCIARVSYAASQWAKTHGLAIAVAGKIWHILKPPAEAGQEDGRRPQVD